MTKLEARIALLEQDTIAQAREFEQRIAALEARISGCVCEQMGELVRGQYWCPLHGMRYPPAPSPAEPRCGYVYADGLVCGARRPLHSEDGGVTSHPFTPAPTEPPAREEHRWENSGKIGGSFFWRNCRDCEARVGYYIELTPPPAASEAGECSHGLEAPSCDIHGYAPSPSAKPKECYCGAPKQTVGGHAWNPAKGCGSEPLTPIEVELAAEEAADAKPKEARRWTLCVDGRGKAEVVPLDGHGDPLEPWSEHVRVIELTPEVEAALDEFRNEETRADMHANINRQVSDALRQGSGDSWHDLGAKVGRLYMQARADAAEVARLRDQAHWSGCERHFAGVDALVCLRCELEDSEAEVKR